MLDLRNQPFPSLNLVTKQTIRNLCYLLLLLAVLYFIFQQKVHSFGISQYYDQIGDSNLLLDETEDSFTDTDSVLSAIQIQESRSEEDVAISAVKNISNVPLEIWMKEKSRINTKNNCSIFPNPLDIKFNNIYWQILKSFKGTFYLYGAYYDNRTLNIEGPSIRVLAMLNRIEPEVKTFCQLWVTASDDPVTVPVVEYKYLWNKSWGLYRQGILQPYLMTCHLPPALNNLIPVSVSITEKECEAAANNLVVVHTRPKAKKKFGVCVKGLDFLHLDLSFRLIEWIEMLTILGAEKLFMYVMEVHPNVYKVLQYYQNIGKVEVTPISLPGEYPNLPGLRHLFLKSHTVQQYQNEVIPYNDCLYRNLYSFEHLVLIDTDEVILPKNADTWSELLDDLQSKALAKGNYTRDSYNFRNVYFWTDKNNSQNFEPDIPHYMHMLQHTNRSVNYTRPGHYVKCFHNVERVYTLHNHYPSSCLSGWCSTYDVDPEIAHLQHYRSDCVPELKKVCDSNFKANVVKDTTIWRYKKQLIRRVSAVLRKLNVVHK